MIDTLFETVEAFLDELIAGKKQGKPGLEHIRNFTSKRNTGLSFDGSDFLQDEKMSFRNALVVGGTGTGKSSIFITPNIQMERGPASYFITDPSGELTAINAALMTYRGFNVKILNLTDARNSDFYNPMNRLDKSFSSCKQLASILVKSTIGDAKGNELFWNTSAMSLISCFLYITMRLDKPFRHLTMTLNLINAFGSGSKRVDELALMHCKNPIAWGEYKALKAIDARLLQNIISTARVALNLWQDEDISYITSKDNFNFEELRKVPTVYFVQGNSLKSKYYSPIFSAMITQLFQTLLNTIPDASSLPIYCLLDELPQYYIPDFQDILSVNRKFKISIVGCVQSTSQLNSVYSERGAEIIMANMSSQLYFTNQDLPTCKKISEIAGSHFVENEEGKKVKEPVLPIEVIRTLPANHAVLLLPATKPVFIDELYPYYQNKKLMRLIESTPPFTCKNAENYTGVTPMFTLN
jgi:type IV secretory pathway TraG/TraD family ATPase VirD4